MKTSGKSLSLSKEFISFFPLSASVITLKPFKELILLTKRSRTILWSSAIAIVKDLPSCLLVSFGKIEEFIHHYLSAKIGIANIIGSKISL
jgi:hypothetical protein